MRGINVDLLEIREQLVQTKNGILSAKSSRNTYALCSLLCMGTAVMNVYNASTQEPTIRNVALCSLNAISVGLYAHLGYKYHNKSKDLQLNQEQLEIAEQKELKRTNM